MAQRTRTMPLRPPSRASLTALPRPGEATAFLGEAEGRALQPEEGGTRAMRARDRSCHLGERGKALPAVLEPIRQNLDHVGRAVRLPDQGRTGPERHRKTLPVSPVWTPELRPQRFQQPERRLAEASQGLFLDRGSGPWEPGHGSTAARASAAVRWTGSPAGQVALPPRRRTQPADAREIVAAFASLPCREDPPAADAVISVS